MVSKITSLCYIFTNTGDICPFSLKNTFSKDILYFIFLLTSSGFLFDLKCDLQIRRSAPLVSLCLLCLQHRVHTYSHTVHTQQALIWAGGELPEKSTFKRLLLGGLPPGHKPGGQLTLTCSAGTHSHFSPGTYFYRQGPSPSISGLIYMCCAQVHLRGRTPDGRCTPRCSQRRGGRRLSACTWASASGWRQVWAEMGFRPLVSPL